MKYCLLRFLLFILTVFIPLAVVAQSPLEDLYKNKQYFELRDELDKLQGEKSADLLFYRGIVANRFNQVQKSSGLLNRYLATRRPAHVRNAYETLADNYARTYNYGQATDLYRLLLRRFKGEINAEEKKDYENSFGLWDALRNSPKQIVVLKEDLNIQGSRDKANLLNLPVEINQQKMSFVFDTGANLSTMTVSTSNKLGLKIIETSVSVSSSSDIKVKSKLAVVPVLKVGSAAVYNVVFLVLDDKALSFPQIDYQIDGIIGFPAIEALGNITITRKDEVSVKMKNNPSKNESNMCLEDLKPLVAGIFNGQKMIFTFDSGAVTSTFYPRFFEAGKNQILKEARSKKIKLGGAGGYKELNAYFLKDLNLMIGGKNAKFAEAEIITENINEESRDFYGNLGQDLIKQFERLTMDFRSMQLLFE